MEHSATEKQKYNTYQRKRNKQLKLYKPILNAVYGNVYTSYPITKRKLIEKYSTARYNFNTKFVLKKSYLRKRERLKEKKIKSGYRCSYELQECEKLKEQAFDSRRLEKTELHSNVEKSLICDKETYWHKYEQKQPSKVWKIAPNDFYHRLWEKCKCNFELQTNTSKKRKRKGCRKKIAYNKQMMFHSDPYLDCLNDSGSICKPYKGRSADCLGVVMYLGVNRPLFPLIYRNITLLNGSKDTHITEFWAEFALSTLIVNHEDKICKSVLVSVKDPELRSLIAECSDSTQNFTSSWQTLNEDRHKTEIKLQSKYVDDTEGTESSFENENFKGCVVALSKFNKTQVPALSLQNISKQYIGANFSENEQMEEKYCNRIFDKNVPSGIEKKENDELHYFGFRSTRTHSLMIDYTSRNRTIVYLYKLQKMLDFQKSNNKYFTSCDYILIDHVETDDSIDILNVPAMHSNEIDPSGEENIEMQPSNIVNQAERCKRSKNPNDVFKFSKISEWKENLTHITPVKMDYFKLKNASCKWLSLKFDSSIINVSYAEKWSLRHRLLFEVMYRAELSKKVICCPIEGKKEIHPLLKFGVYAFPGVCDSVFIGPYSLDEKHELTVMMRLPNGNIQSTSVKTLEEKTKISQQDGFLNHIKAKWWWLGKSFNSNDLNEQHLQFLFGQQPLVSQSETETLNLNKILRKHNCCNFYSYQIGSKEHNYVLFHDAVDTSRKVGVLGADIKEGRRKGNRMQLDNTSRSISNNLRIRRKRVDHLCCRKRSYAHKSKSPRNYTFKRSPKNENFRRTLRSRMYGANHIEKERKRRLEFRNFKNRLELVLNDQVLPESSSAVSLISILQKSVEMINWLEEDTWRLIKEGKSLRKKQMTLLKSYLTLLENFHSESLPFKEGVNFLAHLKMLKENNKGKLSGAFQSESFSSEMVLHKVLADMDSDEMSPIFLKFLQKHHTSSRIKQNELIPASVNNKINIKSRTNTREKNNTGNLPKARRWKTQKASRSNSTNEESAFNISAARQRTANPVYFSEGITERDPLGDDTFHNINEKEKTLQQNSTFYFVDAGTERVIASFQKGSPAFTYTPYLDHSYCEMDYRFASSSFKPSLLNVNNKRKINYKIANSASRNVESTLPDARCEMIRNSTNSRSDGEKNSNLRKTKRVVGKTTCERDTVTQEANFHAVIKEKSSNQVSIDIMEHRQVFARLNIAKIHDVKGNASSSGAALDGSGKILNLIQKILSRIQLASKADTCTNEQEPSGKNTLLIKALLVRKLRSLIEQMELKKKKSVLTYENVLPLDTSEKEVKSASEPSPATREETTWSSSSTNSDEEEIDGATFNAAHMSSLDDGISSISRCDFKITDIENILIEEEVEEVLHTDEQCVENSIITSFEDRYEHLDHEFSVRAVHSNHESTNILPLTNASCKSVLPKFTAAVSVSNSVMSSAFATAPCVHNAANGATRIPKECHVFCNNLKSHQADTCKSAYSLLNDIEYNVPSADDEQFESAINEKLPSSNSGVEVTSKIDFAISKDDSTRICVKPFACVGNFELVFPSNIDKLLNLS